VEIWVEVIRGGMNHARKGLNGPVLIDNQVVHNFTIISPGIQRRFCSKVKIIERKTT